MKVPGPGNLRGHNARESGAVLLQQDAVVEQAGGMDHAPERRHALTDARQLLADCLVLADVHAGNDDLGGGAHRFDFSAGRGGAARSTGEDQVPRPFLDHPTGNA